MTGGWKRSGVGLRLLAGHLLSLSGIVSLGASEQRSLMKEADVSLFQPLQRYARLSSSELEALETILKEPPRIVLRVYFDYNSALINAEMEPQLRELGKALSSPELKDQTFLVIGFGEPSAGERYTIDLAERRAKSVKRFLIDYFGVPADKLVTVGYSGRDRLVNATDPFAPENRRVEIVNMGGPK
jgi:outer membrane protein OmpA-like peptidoglycan-associated protein